MKWIEKLMSRLRLAPILTDNRTTPNFFKFFSFFELPHFAHRGRGIFSLNEIWLQARFGL